jgi:hypothetical protein
VETAKRAVDFHDVKEFTQGSCYQLAEVINEATGWPIYAFWDEYTRDYDMHMFVRTPRGTFLDVLGEHTRYQMLHDWDEKHIRKVKKGFNLHIWDFGNPYFDSTQRAREIMPWLLAKYQAGERIAS